MSEFIQQLINGLSLGSIYALIALGYTMVYGILKFINFAHGEVFMLGAFSGYYLAKAFGIDTSNLPMALIILLLTMIITAAIGVTIEKLAYRPLRRSSKLTVLITAIGVSLFLQYTGQLIFGAAPRSFPNILEGYKISVGGAQIDSNQIVVIISAIILMLALRFIVMKTKIGTAIRAVSNNMTASSLMGINIDTVISFTFAIGSALAGAAGILYSINYPSIDPLMGLLPGLKAFIAAVLGGIGNFPGAALGGLVIGVVETLTVGYLSPTFRDAVAFAILIIILIFKPTGLLGTKEIEKV
ncbi:MAG: branched-chain amino acid ABC transporter permease [Ignavibacteriae bacterium]|nr:branched-chain amino acid ABC transporter permease [Ignavibacteriota bacterium]MCB9242072.1 branched-chain amino acid ABC transporter permease [Ignavibacteriales bacterium]